jgi:hypothetical protein
MDRNIYVHCHLSSDMPLAKRKQTGPGGIIILIKHDHNGNFPEREFVSIGRIPLDFGSPEEGDSGIISVL